MLKDQDAALRLLRRYQWMFRFSLTMLAIGLLVTASGIVAAIVGKDATLAFFGVFIMSWSGLNAYKFVSSTVRILDRGGHWTQV